MKIKKEVLQEVATELDALLFVKPQMSVKLEPDKLAEEIKEASVLLQSDDNISPDTVDILSQIWKGCESELKELAKEEDTKNIIEAFQTLGIITRSEPEEKEKEEKVAKEKKETKKDEEDSLVSEVEDAERLKDLKDIAKANDEFKELRGKLNGFKDEEVLRGEMLEILDGQVPVKTPEPKTEPKKDEKKAVMKIVPKDKPEKKITPKAEKKTEKKVPGITRQSAVFIAIRKVCKKGGSINDIAEEANSVYMENNPESKGISKLQNMSNVVRHSILALVEFEVLSEKNGKYSF